MELAHLLIDVLLRVSSLSNTEQPPSVRYLHGNVNAALQGRNIMKK